MTATLTNRKATKSEMKSALDCFFWSLADATGGTRQETFSQALHAISRLESLAAKVAELAANPSKPLLQDAHLMERASVVPARIAKYRESYVTPNVILFPR